MTDPKLCGFDVAWVGPCGKAAGESGRCEKHSGLVCCSCGNPATRECGHTHGLVCGANLCADCCHLPPKETESRYSFGYHGPRANAEELWAENFKRWEAERNA